MKKLLFIMTVMLFLVPIVLADPPTNDCYQNFTEIRCGEQSFFNNAQYCEGANLTIDDCYNEGENFVVLFSGIKYFKMPDEISRVTFFFYSRSWSWLGDETKTPLPANSIINQINETHFRVVSPLGGKKIESVQITVPYCYNQVNSYLEKVYPRTQAGKICRIVKNEQAQQVNDEIPDTSAEQVITTTTTTVKEKDNSWILAILLIFVVIIGTIIFLRKPKSKKK